MKTRSKAFLTPDHATLALVEDQGGGKEALITSIRIPRAEFLRIASIAVATQAGATPVIYGDGGGTKPDELPL